MAYRPSPPSATSTLKRHSHSVSSTISSSFNPCSCPHTNITHLTIFSSIDPSSSSSSSSSSQSISFRKTLPKKSLKNAKIHQYDSTLPVVLHNDTVNCKEELKNDITVIKKGVPIRFRKMRSIILLNIIAIVYASDIPVVKEVEAFLDPAAFCAVRFSMSAIPFFPFVFRARNDVQTRNAGMELGLWVSLGYLVEALGLLTSDAGRASFISLFTVIVVPLLESMLGSIVPARTWFGILMSVLGVAMLECSGSPPNVGDLLNFLSAIFFGIHMLRTEHISRSTKKENFLALLGYEVSVVAMLSAIWYLIGGWFDGVHDYNKVSLAMVWDWMVVFPWIPALYTGVFSTGLCLWAEIAAMRDVSATETAVIYGMEPVWGAGFAWFLLGERWGVAGWIGAALILGGSLTVQIFGSSVSKSSAESEESIRKSDVLMTSADDQKLQNGLSTSPVVVSSRNDIIDMLK
ncbi:uncharacterized protein LOC114264681 [Camellia sinensis]|uniref:uncharacterized protein LOC114264681 n=1 Tax=Camellia sinensis TaxID=4442 RepID=UPI001035806D|nr:uncharacterized protein LOC114264681 [Camellia sinensis]